MRSFCRRRGAVVLCEIKRMTTKALEVRSFVRNNEAAVEVRIKGNSRVLPVNCLSVLVALI